MTENPNPARVYCGTYAKYNAGSLFGQWLDLSDFADKEEFLARCKELHKDEPDPELMFQDWENIPDCFIGESYIKESLWPYLEAVEDLSEDEREALKDYADNFSQSQDGIDIDDFRDKYAGKWDSEKEFAEHLADEWGWPEAMEKAGISPNYFDADAYAADLFLGGNYWRSKNGHVFSNQ